MFLIGALCRVAHISRVLHATVDSEVGSRGLEGVGV
jgi:hypothetical protein